MVMNNADRQSKKFYKTLLFLVISFFLFTSVHSQCNNNGVYFNYGIGTNYKNGNTITLEIGPTTATSSLFVTGVLKTIDLGVYNFFTSYGIQINNKTRFGNNNLIQFVNVLNTHDSYKKQTRVSSTAGIKWLQRLYKESDLFLTGSLECSYLNFNSLKSRETNNSVLISEIGVACFFRKKK
jgi:hypothetical protein